jgi:hypothetical protein
MIIYRVAGSWLASQRNNKKTLQLAVYCFMNYDIMFAVICDAHLTDVFVFWCHSCVSYVKCKYGIVGGGKCKSRMAGSRMVAPRRHPPCPAVIHLTVSCVVPQRPAASRDEFWYWIGGSTDNKYWISKFVEIYQKIVKIALLWILADRGGQHI